MIIYGWKQYAQVLAVPTMVCQQCALSSEHVLRRLTTKATLFFIPLFPINRKHTVLCTACEHEAKVPHEQAMRLAATGGQGAPPYPGPPAPQPAFGPPPGYGPPQGPPPPQPYPAPPPMQGPPPVQGPRPPHPPFPGHPAHQPAFGPPPGYGPPKGPPPQPYPGPQPAGYPPPQPGYPYPPGR